MSVFIPPTFMTQAPSTVFPFISSTRVWLQATLPRSVNQYLIEIQEIDPADHATLDALNPAASGSGSGTGGRTLADMIFDQMQGGAVSKGIDEDEGLPDPRKGLNPKVVEVYTK